MANASPDYADARICRASFRLRSLGAAAAACAVLVAAPAQGNDTAINSGAHGPAPLGEFAGEESIIRMVVEKIDIQFGRDQSTVACRFTFRSSKVGGGATQTVGFPDVLTGDDVNIGSIRSLETFVDGRKVDAKKVTGWFETADYGIPRSGLGEPRADAPKETIQRADFYTVDVTFPAERDVVIERRYVADNGADVMGTKTLSYTTHTGAVWKDTIGRADFHVTLDGWMVADLAFEDGPQRLPPRQQSQWSSPNLKEWTVVSPTELTMTWENFEPAVHKTRRGIFLATWSTRKPDGP